MLVTSKFACIDVSAYLCEHTCTLAKARHVYFIPAVDEWKTRAMNLHRYKLEN